MAILNLLANVKGVSNHDQIQPKLQSHSNEQIKECKIKKNSSPKLMTTLKNIN